MRNWLFAGVAVAVIIVFIAWMTDRWVFILEVAGPLGFGAFMLSGILLCLFLDGQIVRNLTKKKRRMECKSDYSFHILLFGLPSAAAAVLYLIR
ncbi:DUF5316 family protein [Fictibacillus terranigra]|uniref:DUF5316 family protein n=1 Tax=Fictibacillus terranigra TaxID=3058424 RepID=A0ABT8ECA7_9BACL|nr:DUF5316 family protein [Fictibacillus sp. CENA-BCM004]MDN4075551.1 DUF5316 family protein [Fictibacillus sp. CENA-BCM004]